jgi:hypothetical protein
MFHVKHYGANCVDFADDRHVQVEQPTRRPSYHP